MKPPPAFLFYPDDFIAGTVDMTTEETGFYWTLLCVQWSRGGLPDDDAELIRFYKPRLGSTKDLVQPTDAENMLKNVRRKFIIGPDGLLRNARLEAERAKQTAFRHAQSVRGKASAKARFNRASTKDLVQPKGNSSFKLKVSKKDKDFKEDQESSGKASDGRRLTESQLEVASRIEKALGVDWVHDSPKWKNRVRTKTNLCIRVISEVEDASKHGRVKQTNAKYAEYCWKEFSR